MSKKRDRKRAPVTVAAVPPREPLPGRVRDLLAQIIDLPATDPVGRLERLSEVQALVDELRLRVLLEGKADGSWAALGDKLGTSAPAALQMVRRLRRRGNDGQEKHA